MIPIVLMISCRVEGRETIAFDSVCIDMPAVPRADEEVDFEDDEDFLTFEVESVSHEPKHDRVIVWLATRLHGMENADAGEVAEMASWIGKLLKEAGALDETVRPRCHPPKKAKDESS